jgi:hypothetical protein
MAQGKLLEALREGEIMHSCTLVHLSAFSLSASESVAQR